jgi:hypothetical protein
VLYLQWFARKSDGVKLNGTHHRSYADDVNLLEDNIDTLKENTDTSIDGSKEVGEKQTQR